MDEPEPEICHGAPSEVESDAGIRGHAERLGQQLAALYNENTLLRERVRALERQARAVTEPEGAVGHPLAAGCATGERLRRSASASAGT